MKNKTKTLYGIWIGGNDYFFDRLGEPEKLTTNVVDSIVWAITTLADRGGKNFLVLNLPDLSRTPFITDGNESNEYAKRLSTLTMMHNKKLAIAIEELKKSYPDIKIQFVDIYHIFNELIDSPEKYNQQYNVHITKTTHACWGGGYLIKNTLSEQTLATDIKQDIINSQGKVPSDVDVQEITNYIKNSPSLALTYNMGKLYAKGVLPCDDADAYLFWDQIHPTAVVHQLLSKMVMSTLSDTLK